VFGVLAGAITHTTDYSHIGQIIHASSPKLRAICTRALLNQPTPFDSAAQDSARHKWHLGEMKNGGLQGDILVWVSQMFNSKSPRLALFSAAVPKRLPSL
jgi:hypothetical protein